VHNALFCWIWWIARIMTDIPPLSRIMLNTVYKKSRNRKMRILWHYRFNKILRGNRHSAPWKQVRQQNQWQAQPSPASRSTAQPGWRRSPASLKRTASSPPTVSRGGRADCFPHRHQSGLPSRSRSTKCALEAMQLLHHGETVLRCPRHDVTTATWVLSVFTNTQICL